MNQLGSSEMARREYVLRPARPEDTTAVLALLRASQLPVAGVEESFESFIVAEDAGRIVGAAGLEVYGTDGLLRSVVVDAEYRGRGLGRALTEAILAMAVQDGLSNVYLLTESAEGFFPRHGFRRISREEASDAVKTSAEFTELCPASSAVMQRLL